MTTHDNLKTRLLARNRSLPSPEYLRERLRYEPETGKLFWREHPGMPKQWNTRLANKEAFVGTSRGYPRGSIGDQCFNAHRVIWAMVYGEWPEMDIDHIDHDRANNRLGNLRLVSHQENCRNRVMLVTNKSGVTGVRQIVLRNNERRWVATIKHGGKYKGLGWFHDFEQAVAARKTAEREYGYHPNHGAKA